MMSKVMERRAVLKDMIDVLPEEKIKFLLNFAVWIREERFSPSEISLIQRGEKEIKRGEYVRWRDVKRT